ncbi:DUF5916 domain-containing protein [Jejuia spongiicola]|uniref:Carbohydrate binding family 9 domain-containing protein n=1 Tax=Jejuia spongiicola TaxID=2942207 RepID=A0ABT0QCE3_9FLAO|nr:DUF5916 domain-containing protein [Jejuia spongiicola]MCL6294620.1 carbohydrate binding family 9 domain-containing protein [Jejuia spongiicola]
MKISIKVLVLLLINSNFLVSQEKTIRNTYKYSIKEAVSIIKVDGIENDGEWNAYQTIDTFYNHNPSDVGVSKYKSEIKLTFDNKYLYIIAKHYDDGKRIVQSLQRDSDDAHWGSESFTVAIDPINKKQSGVLFGVNAGGAEHDGSLLIQPSRTTYTDTWDQRWFSSTKQYNRYWLVEMAIPFSSLRYNPENLHWGINFIRGHKTENFYYTWTPFPINFNGIDVNYMGTLQWPKVPVIKNNIAFIKPYTTLSSLKDNQAENTSTKTNVNAGIDLKVGITKSLNADITYNPDFSNADVDAEVTNITRFDISLPEQREFFIENGDIFSSFGSYSINPFFSRRVGLNTPIVYGARVTGNISDDLRIGIMNLQTEKSDGIDAQNNTIAAFNYKVLNRSQLRGLFVNRQETGNNNVNDYARNFGSEFTYISKKGNFNNSIKYHASINDENSKGSYFGINGSYATRRFSAGWTLDAIDKDYQADLGFTPRIFNYDANNQSVIRKGYIFLNPYVTYKFFSKKQSSKLIFQGFRFFHNIFLNSDGSLNERDNSLAYDLRFKNTSEFSVIVSNREVNLGFATNFLGNEYDNLPIGNYNFTSATLSYSADTRSIFTYDSSVTYGHFYNGYRFSGDLTGNVRFGYWGKFSLTYNYNKINLPNSYGKVNLHLLSARGLFSFTNKLFFNNTIQYNSQSENFSVFSKLQWRYSPLSDIFLIYNQNNNTHNFNLNNKSIILKLTYRFAV